MDNKAYLGILLTYNGCVMSPFYFTGKNKAADYATLAVGKQQKNVSRALLG